MPKAVKNRVSSNDRTFIKNAGKLISVGIISETNADMYMNFLIFVNIATTLFPGILFQLFLPCILLNFSFILFRINACWNHTDSLIGTQNSIWSDSENLMYQKKQGL